MRGNVRVTRDGEWEESEECSEISVEAVELTALGGVRSARSAGATGFVGGANAHWCGLTACAVGLSAWAHGLDACADEMSARMFDANACAVGASAGAVDPRAHLGGARAGAVRRSACADGLSAQAEGLGTCADDTSFRVLDASPCAVGAIPSAGETGAPLLDSDASNDVVRTRLALMSACIQGHDAFVVEACVPVAGATIQVRTIFSGIGARRGAIAALEAMATTEASGKDGHSHLHGVSLDAIVQRNVMRAVTRCARSSEAR